MINSALIIKLSAIGDVIMALPAIEALRLQNPKARIIWMCGKAVAPLLDKLDLADDLIVVDEYSLLTGNIFIKIISLLKIWIRLFGQKYDLVITGHADPKYRLLSLTLFAGRRVRFRRDKKRNCPIPGRHHSDEYVRLATGKDDPQLPTLALPKINWPLPEKLRQELPAERTAPLVAFAPGGAKNVLHEDALRRWPLEHYAELAKRLIRKNVSVILTGAPDDKWVLPAFAGLNIIDLIGKTNLVELVELYQSCDLVITHDSGPLHLASLAGTPQIALFGPTIPNEKVPRNLNSVILWGGENLACRPCYDGRSYADCTNNLCLKSVSIDSVFDAAKKIMAKTSRSKQKLGSESECREDK